MSEQTLDLQALKQLCEKATPGPWRYDDNNDHGSPLIYAGGGRDEPVVAFKQSTYDEEAWWLVSDPDAQFIVAAREYLPILIAEIERLRVVTDEAGWFMKYGDDQSDRADRLQALLNEATELLTEAVEWVDGFDPTGSPLEQRVRGFLKEGNPT